MNLDLWPKPVAQGGGGPVGLAVLCSMPEPLVVPARGCTGGCWICDPFMEKYNNECPESDNLPEADFLGRSVGLHRCLDQAKYEKTYRKRKDKRCGARRQAS